ncbi:hypothetical protein BDN67DRAFT_418204 [Paxillus ammoniavirescens]|nr:hypothetical protein BDN67DRAFT_418204 [Paxillus ammoniavirescens]
MTALSFPRFPLFALARWLPLSGPCLSQGYRTLSPHKTQPFQLLRSRTGGFVWTPSLHATIFPALCMLRSFFDQPRTSKFTRRLYGAIHCFRPHCQSHFTLF